MAKKTVPQICIITVTGKDKVGIVARLASMTAKAGINIIDINQRIMADYFVMMMNVDTEKATISMEDIQKRLDKIAKDMELVITFQHEDIFKTMHRV